MTGQRLVTIKTPKDRTVAVRELRWGDAIGFIQLLSAELSGLVGVDANGRAAIDSTKIPELVRTSSALTDYLVEKSTDITPVELRDSSASDALEVIDAALEVNLNDTLLGKLRKVGARVMGAFGATPTPDVRS